MTDDWRPPEPNSFAPGDEQFPWARWLGGGVLLFAIAAGAIWLASMVILPETAPGQSEREQTVAANEAAVEAPPAKKSSDDEAWVRALEQDTLEGYREYLALFPNGKHAAEAQAEIDRYDDEAWANAERRNTIAGYEDYLEAWPEGRHASKARERIAEMKAAAEAIAEDAAERASQEAADWDKAARENTVESYGTYLAKHPSGIHADEAQRRMNALRAAAADKNAWDQAASLNTVAGYQQYLSSFPQGAYVMQATAALEKLKPAPGRTFKDCDECPQMVVLPTGTAELGAKDSDTAARPNEKPARAVTFSDMFAMSVTEVTFDEWRACESAGACTSRPSDNGWGAGRRPVINITWNDAQSYAAWLSQKTGQTYTLPTEAQWEYAARGGESGTWQGGSTKALCAFANGASRESGLQWSNADCTDPASDRTMPAGTLAANKFGLKDMIGNVGEWTLDCNTLNLRDAPTNGAADMRGSCNQRAVRGGSWFSGANDLRFTARLMQRLGDSNDFTGLRLVREIPK